MFELLTEQWLRKYLPINSLFIMFCIFISVANKVYEMRDICDHLFC